LEALRRKIIPERRNHFLTEVDTFCVIYLPTPQKNTPYSRAKQQQWWEQTNWLIPTLWNGVP